ncbi:carbohydrate-binding module family 13 protein [Mycena alexandri]|uniref:Carbohydrate-binding module family 13 protein n=1 Tax=Mycena alexandri TaxID=1745969 RepID=A0AAD6XDH9_9AGAR|nr:carbohydrate-binding module family 13 protein [Mycena alexandri]
MPFAGEGIYTIQNVNGLAVDLHGGSPNDGTKIQGYKMWPMSDAACLGQLWLVKRVPLANGIRYTLQNLRGGTYMDLQRGSSANGTPVIGHQLSITNGTLAQNQQWEMFDLGIGIYRFRNYMAQTFLDLDGGRDKNETKIQGWSGDDPNNGHQRWTMTQRSMHFAQIDPILRANQFVITKADLHGYNLDTIYFILDNLLLEAIWKVAGLNAGMHRPELFDSDDFAMAFKSQVAKWGQENIRASGLSILCGFMVGSNPQGNKHGYNWSLSNNEVVFIEPQTGGFAITLGYIGEWGIY